MFYVFMSRVTPSVLRLHTRSELGRSSSEPTWATTTTTNITTTPRHQHHPHHDHHDNPPKSIRLPKDQHPILAAACVNQGFKSGAWKWLELVAMGRLKGWVSGEWLQAWMMHHQGWMMIGLDVVSWYILTQVVHLGWHNLTMMAEYGRHG